MRNERCRGRAPNQRALGPPRRLRSVERHAHIAGRRRPRRQRGRRPLRLSNWPGTGFARCRARRAGRLGLHRWRRRARRPDPRPGLSRRKLARHHAGRSRQRGGRPAHFGARLQDLRLGGADRREFDGGATYKAAARPAARRRLKEFGMNDAANPAAPSEPLSDEELRLIDAWWRAANYLSVGQIYLLDNPLLKQPLELAHIKPRLLGHWGTTPGLNFLYVHLNRIIKARGLDMIYIAGPGHGGPGNVANTWLEGTYSETYVHVAQNERGMQRVFKQFIFPGGIPSHVAPETPGSIHEGGELGYALSHAYGAALDSPDLIVACVVGDGEAETGPLATGWHGNKFLNPDRDGCVLPI